MVLLAGAREPFLPVYKWRNVLLDVDERGRDLKQTPWGMEKPHPGIRKSIRVPGIA
jgi:hypothetical protein